MDRTFDVVHSCTLQHISQPSCRIYPLGSLRHPSSPWRNGSGGKCNLGNKYSMLWNNNWTTQFLKMHFYALFCTFFVLFLHCYSLLTLKHRTLPYLCCTVHACHIPICICSPYRIALLDTGPMIHRSRFHKSSWIDCSADQWDSSNYVHNLKIKVRYCTLDLMQKL